MRWTCVRCAATVVPRDLSAFVPRYAPPDASSLIRMQQFMHSTTKLLVISGAGISTESGIPDYRSEAVGLYARRNHKPIQFQEFLRNSSARQRYWARNYVGWPHFSSAMPNASHRVLSEWERKGHVSWIITQNVDGLHLKAGSRKLTELHGSSFRVHCLTCNHVITRDAMQTLLAERNPEWSAHTVDVAPDGDVVIADDMIEKFEVPPCTHCGGILKPQIVFFGDNVPRDVVMNMFQQVEHCDSVLVCGSSLQVFSAYRFVIAAHERKKPIAIVNIGPTRADALATISMNTRCSDVLTSIYL